MIVIVMEECLNRDTPFFISTSIYKKPVVEKVGFSNLIYKRKNYIMIEKYFADNYERREFIGFHSLLDLQKLHPDTFRFEIKPMPQGKAFDAYYFITDGESMSIKKRVFIEIKIRDSVYPDYYLQKKKWDNIEKYRKSVYVGKEEVLYLYINFTPEGTFIWNITEMDPKKLEWQEMNEYTETSRTEKVKKQVWRMEKSEAKKFDYIINERRILSNWEQKYLLPKVKEKVRKYPCLLDILLSDDEPPCQEKKD